MCFEKDIPLLSKLTENKVCAFVFIPNSLKLSYNDKNSSRLFLKARGVTVQCLPNHMSHHH